MRKDVVLVTNNPCFQQLIDSSRLMFINGTSLDALSVARDAIHLGSELLTHPLYGNLRPDQQPFRSTLIRNFDQQKERNLGAVAYLESISAIEEAVLLYSSYGSRMLTPEYLHGTVRDEYAFLDFELMRESLTSHGLLQVRNVSNFAMNLAEGGE